MNRCAFLRFLLILLMALATKLSFAATTNTVLVGDFFYSPKVLTITNGDTVRWTNIAAITSHDVTSSNTPPAWTSSGLFSRTPFFVKFTSVGSFPYHCQFHQGTHPEQNGTITVVAGAPTAVRILSPKLTNDTFSFRFPSESGFSYFVEAKDSVEAAPQTITNLNGTGSLVTIFDSNTNAQRFYRVGAH